MERAWSVRARLQGGIRGGGSSSLRQCAWRHGRRWRFLAAAAVRYCAMEQPQALTPPRSRSSEGLRSTSGAAIQKALVKVARVRHADRRPTARLPSLRLRRCRRGLLHARRSSRSRRRTAHRRRAEHLHGILSVSAASASCTSSLAASSLAAITTHGGKPACRLPGFSFSVASAAFGRFQPWYRPYMFNVLISACEL